MAIRELTIRGVIPNLITPFTPGGEIAWEEVGKETAFLDQAGVDGVCVGGHLSGTAGSTPEEMFRLVQTVRGSTQKPLLATIFPDSEPEAIQLLESACTSGADAVLVAQPHYLFQPDPNSLLSMYHRLKQRAATPLLLANVMDSARVDRATMIRMIEHGIVDGIVQGAEDAHLLVDLLRLRPRVPVFSALEDLHYVALMLGAEGLVSDLAALFPFESVGLYRDFAGGNHEGARLRHQKLLRSWRVIDHPAERLGRVRAALSSQGRNVGPPRSPYAFLPPESVHEVADALRRESIITA